MRETVDLQSWREWFVPDGGAIAAYVVAAVGFVVAALWLGF